MSIWYWILIAVAVILLIVLIILFARERVKNKKPVTVPSKQTPTNKIVFITGGQTVQAGSVSGMITIQIQDVNGNPAYVTSKTVITLSSSSRGIFSANSNGLPVITSVTVYAGTNAANFYYKDSTKGNPTITASNDAIAPGTQTETIN